MGVHSGKFGAIDGESSVRDWSLNDAMTPSAYVVSGSLGGRVRTAGIQTWDGSYNQLLGEPSLLPGASGSFAGYTAPDTDILGASGVQYSGTIISSECAIMWNWEGSEAVACSTTFVGNGALTVGAAAVTDDTVPAPLSICPCHIDTSPTGSVWTPIPNLTSATLTLTCDIVEYVNSSTNCTTGRVAGPVDWTLELNQQDNIRAAHIDIGDELYFRCYVDDTDFWLLKWGIVRDFTNLTVNVESGEIISRTINVDMNGAVGGVIGHVVSPSAVLWWGDAPT